MSKHVYEINFEELKFNLYELLAVPKDCSEQKIKKAYRKLIIKFHPDKNDIIDEEIYNHLTTANQVLTNSTLRSKYDEWLNSYGQDNQDHHQLKNNYKENSKIACEIKTKEEANLSFKEKSDLLNKKHGFDADFEEKSISLKYDQKMKELNSDVEFIDLNVKNSKDFDKKFQLQKNEEIKCQQLMKLDSNIMEYNQQDIGNEYSSITNYNLLYSNDSIQGENFSNLDNAFLLQPKIKFHEENIDKKIKEYKKQSSDLSTFKFNN
tara:strand:- start:422 stop:1213 length:792 start_codon:yes stop_codon:yes gene_type:complete